MKKYLIALTILIGISVGGYYVYGLTLKTGGQDFGAGNLNKVLAGYWKLDKENSTTGTTNFVVNGTFDADANWIKGSGWNIATGTANSDGTQVASSNLTQQNILKNTATKYAITYTISNRVSGSVRAYAGNTAGTTRSADGTYTDVLTPSLSESVIIQASADFVGSIDNVTAYDVSGNVIEILGRNNGASVTSQTYTTDRKGQSNRALNFNGTTDYVNLGNSLNTTSSFTYSFWLKPDDGQSGAYHSIFSRWEATSNKRGFLVRQEAGGEIRVYLSSNGSIADVYETTDSAFFEDGGSNWNNLVVVYDASGQTVKIYKNGVIQDSTTTGSIPSSIYYNSSNTLIGSDQGGSPLFFDGAIDDVRIYNRVLSQSEITTLYDSYYGSFSAGSLSKGLVGDWSLDYENTSPGADLNTDANAISVVNEADAITGWSDNGFAAAGANVFESQSTTTSNSVYAFKADSNDTPTQGARIYKDIQTDFGLYNGRTYKISFDIRHTGAGGIWEARIGSTDTATIGFTILSSVDSSDTTYQSVSTTFVKASNYVYLVFRENSAGNNGGVYVDNLVIQDVSGKATDITPNVNSGTFIGTNFTTDRKGQANKASSFNGTSDYIQVADNDALSFGNSTSDSPFSFSFWSFIDDASGFEFFAKADGTNAEYVFETLGNDKLFFAMYDNVTSAYIYRTSANAITSLENTWVHFVGTYDGSGASGGIKYYVNTVRDDTTGASSGYTAMHNTNSPFEIGRFNDGSPIYGDGKISDFRLYNRVLSQDEINTLYNSYK